MALECDSPEALNEDICGANPNINSAADACRAHTRKSRNEEHIRFNG